MKFYYIWSTHTLLHWLRHSGKAVTFFYIYQEVVAMTFGVGTVQSFFGFLQSIQADASVVTHNHTMTASLHFLLNYS